MEGAAIVAVAAGILWWLTRGQGQAVGDMVDNVTGGDPTAPRGIRNNNPLNIKWNAANDWRGQEGADSGGFVIFDSPVNGIRAAARILKNYRAQGINTPEGIIKRWTSGDNAVIQASYIDHVAVKLGIYPHEEVLPDLYGLLLTVMIQHENGQQPYSMATIQQGLELGWA